MLGMYDILGSLGARVDVATNSFPSGKKRKTQASSGPNDPNCPYQMAGPRPENVDEENTCALHIGERLSKLEQLFDKFVCRKPSSAGESLDLSRSPTLVDSNEKISKFVGLPEFSSDTQSISSIGDGIVSCLLATPSSIFEY